MNQKFLNLAAITGTTFIGLVFLTWWLLHNPVRGFVENVPGMDGRPEILSTRSEVVNIGAYFARFDGVPGNIRGNWQRFRGADFDNISKENIRLLDGWGDGVPNIPWSIELGEGHAGPVIFKGGKISPGTFFPSNFKNLCKFV